LEENETTWAYAKETDRCCASAHFPRQNWQP